MELTIGAEMEASEVQVYNFEKVSVVAATVVLLMSTLVPNVIVPVDFIYPSTIEELSSPPLPRH